MDFELKQILTQIVAFLIMLWILKRYTWRPLISLLDERTNKIQRIFEEAERKNQQADELKEEYERKMTGIKAEGQLIIQKAVKEAKQIAEELELKAHKKGLEIIEHAHNQSEREIQKAKAELRKEMIDLSFFALEKLIHVKVSKEERERFASEMLAET